MTADRYISVKYIIWRKVYFKSDKAIITCVAFCTFIFFLNFHLYFLNGNTKIVNGTEVVDCFQSPIFPLWEQVSEKKIRKKLETWKCFLFCFLDKYLHIFNYTIYFFDNTQLTTHTQVNS